MTWELTSRDQLKCARQARAGADCAKVAPISGEDAVNLTAFRDCGDSAIDQP
jgi:hypothetical protein